MTTDPERLELEQLRAELAGQPRSPRDPGPPPTLPSTVNLPSLARLLGIDLLVQSAAWQNRALSVLVAAPLWVDLIMSSFDDLNTAVQRLSTDVGNVKTSIDQAVTQLQSIGNLQPAQQSALDAAVQSLTSASSTLESEQAALSSAENPPAPPQARR